MEYIRDGVLAIDRQGNTTGMNPAAVAIFGNSARHMPLPYILPSLSKQELTNLIHAEIPTEKEVLLSSGGQTRTLRIRSQPSKGIIILLVSDVTDLVHHREQARRTAYVQLIGHMAKGVANDFNDLLCGISGHASLLARQNLKTINIPASAAAIQDCAGRGMLLARQLMQFSTPSTGETIATLQTAQHINAGIDLLKACLPSDWTFECAVDSDVAPVNIPPVQLEHLVQSLGLVTADASSSIHHLSITLSKPDGDSADTNTAAVLTIAAPSLPTNDEIRIPQSMDQTGVIDAVINALILQAGGTYEHYATAGGSSVYRLLIPEADPAILAAESPTALAMGLEAYASNWHILIDSDLLGSDGCIHYLRNAGTQVQSVQGLVDVLSAIEGDSHLDAIALSSGILGDNQIGLLKAISRLCPRAGIVVQQREIHNDNGAEIVYVPEHVTPLQLLHAMIEARNRIRTNLRNRMDSSIIRT